jgi:hypothetical protein
MCDTPAPLVFHSLQLSLASENPPLTNQTNEVQPVATRNKKARKAKSLTSQLEPETLTPRAGKETKNPTVDLRTAPSSEPHPIIINLNRAAPRRTHRNGEQAGGGITTAAKRDLPGPALNHDTGELPEMIKEALRGPAADLSSQMSKLSSEVGKIHRELEELKAHIVLFSYNVISTVKALKEQSEQ